MDLDQAAAHVGEAVSWQSDTGHTGYGIIDRVTRGRVAVKMATGSKAFLVRAGRLTLLGDPRLIPAQPPEVGT